MYAQGQSPAGAARGSWPRHGTWTPVRLGAPRTRQPTGAPPHLAAAALLVVAVALGVLLVQQRNQLDQQRQVVAEITTVLTDPHHVVTTAALTSGGRTPRSSPAGERSFSPVSCPPWRRTGPTSCGSWRPDPPGRRSNTAALPLLLPGAVPTHVAIPAIGVSSDLLQLGQNPDGTVQVPRMAKDSKAGWYRYSPMPGERGPAVLLGHVDR